MSENWLIWALGSAVFAALTAVLGKAGVAETGVTVATWIRTATILGILTLMTSAAGQWKDVALVSRRGLTFLVLSGLATGASWLCYFQAMKVGEAARVAPVDKLSVVLVAIFAMLFLGERMDAISWAGVAAIALGAALLAWRG